jgi:uncharacterized protein YaaW (UPF0174 family)
MIAYRFDHDLEFLGKLASEDLEDLVHTLTHDKDGEIRWTEELTGSVGYKQYYPDHQQYWELIAAEIQSLGGNTFANVLRRGKGVLYKEVLTDVCDKMKVNYNKDSTVERIEGNLLMKVLNDTIEKLSPGELKEFAESVGVINVADIASPSVFSAICLSIFKAGGFKSYQLTLIIVNAVVKVLTGSGLRLATNATITRALGVLAGPIGWAITAAWTALDVAGPAYRVTIPAVMQVALLRQKALYGDQAGA